MQTINNEKEDIEINQCIVVLDALDWHDLLNILEFKMKFRNVDRSDAVDLFQKIASQLTNKEVIIVEK